MTESRSPAASTTADHSRIPSVDGLRGVAILLVLLMHFTIYGLDRPAAGVSQLAYKALQAGWIGVDLFFVLSGFLITGILHRSKGRPHFYGNFYLRRTLRIFPLYFGVLAIGLVLLPWVAPDNVRFRGWASQGMWYWTYLTNAMVARYGWSPAAVQGLDHFWSLAVEEQFYLLWPLCVSLLNRRRLILVCVWAILAGPFVRLAIRELAWPIAAYVSTPARLDALAAGALVALIANREGGLMVWRRPARCVALVSAIMLAVIAVARRTFNPEDLVVQTIGYSLAAAMFASVLILTLTSLSGTVRWMLEGRPLRSLGRYSYGLYVFHHPVLFVMPPAVLALSFEATIPVSPIVARAIAIAIVAAVCFALAITSWHCYEQPILKLRDRPIGAALWAFARKAPFSARAART